MVFSTPIDIPSLSTSLSPSSHVVVIGSCFAQHIGRRLEAALPPGNVVVNPFGVLYNPMVMARALEVLMDTAPLPNDIFFCGRDGLWRSWWHAGEFAAPTLEECAQRVKDALAHARDTLRQSELLILTLGTDRYYALKEPLPWGDVVANCHKMPSQLFEERAHTWEEMVRTWEDLLQRLHRDFPQLHIVWTVSPYRYAKYGFHASQLSKAQLLLLVDALCSSSRTSDSAPSTNGFSLSTSDSSPSMSGSTSSTQNSSASSLNSAESTSEHTASTQDSSTSTQNSSASTSGFSSSSLKSSTSSWQNYFPAYEILLDELRDYRYYAADMLHPSEQAVDYIWEKFRAASFSPQLLDCTRQLNAIRQALSHRPLHPESENYRIFYAQIQQRIAEFSQKFGFVPQ